MRAGAKKSCYKSDYICLLQEKREPPVAGSTVRQAGLLQDRHQVSDQPRGLCTVSLTFSMVGSTCNTACPNICNYMYIKVIHVTQLYLNFT